MIQLNTVGASHSPLSIFESIFIYFRMLHYKILALLKHLLNYRVAIMKMLQQKETLEYLVHLIQAQWRGSPSAYAQKLGISESTFFRYLDILKKLDVPVSYNRSGQYYFFPKPVSIKLNFEIEFLDDNSGSSPTPNADLNL